MEEKLMECFENLGIFIESCEKFNIEEYIEDSMSFISLIVEIEGAFEIEVVDEYLDMEKFRTSEDILSLVDKLSM